jgi:hypothetical protein
MNDSLLVSVGSIGIAVCMVVWALMLLRNYRTVGGAGTLWRPVPAEAQEQARRLEHEGQSPEAIKLIRGLTGLRPGEAKAVLEALREGRRLPTDYDESAELLSSMDPQMTGYVRDMMHQGRKTEAIRALRARVDIGQAEAEYLAEALGRRV